MALTLLQPFNLDPNGNYTFANANLTGNVNASYFIGNGSQLTGIAGGNVTTSATPPASPNSGDFWIDSNTGTMYIYFNDGTSNQWAEMESLYAFSSVEPNTTISNGNSNVIVAANSNVTVSVSGNSNVTTFTGSNIFVTANIIPTANITYDLGTTSNRFKDLWLSNSTIYIGAASITTDGGNLVLTNPDGGQSVVSGNQTVSSNTLVESNSNLAVANTYIGLSVNSNANVLLVTASGANITGTANISGNANVGNIGATQVVASGNVSGLYFIGNGSQLTGIDATAINNGNSNVKVTANGNVTVSVAGTSNILVITDTGINASGTMNASGNISASYFIGNGSQLTGIDATAIQNGTANVRTYNNGNVAISANGSANVLVISGTGANIVGTANVSGNANVGNLGATGIVATTISGSLTTASQPNITGLGTLSGLNATGNVVAGNVYANSGTVGASLIAGTLTTVSQPNVTSLGTLGNLSITNNLTVGGNFTVTGNLVYANVSDLVVNDPLIYLASNNVGDTDDIGIVANWDDGVYQHGGMVRDHTDGVWKFFSNVVAEPTTTIDWANAVYDPVKMGSLSVVANITSGNANLGNSVTANYFTGNFYGTANSATTATTAGTVTTAAQPNITSTGTLTSLGVSGNITAANITANTGIFSGNGSGLSQLAGANVSGQVGNSLVAGTVYTAAQPNITSVGTLTAISVTGNGTFGNILGPHANGNSNVNIPAANGNVNISVGGTANVLVVTGTGANIAGTMNVTGNLTAGNITTGNGSGGNVSGVNYLTANYVAGTLTTASQPNITGVGTITSGIWNNNIGSSATFAAGLSGANLASITAANISGTVASATAATNASALLQNTSTSTTVYPTFTTSSANGNSQAVFNTSISANLSNASITATTFVGALSGAATSATTAGTVTTAAQPNITSTGTLTSLTILGNLTVDTNTLFVDSANNSVGIATTTPSYTLHVVGNVYATGDVVSASDMTIKSDVVKIDNALEKLLQLSGYTFLRQGEDMRSAGVSAQDVQKVLPEAVRGSDGALSVAYGALSGLIIESIKDLKSELERIKGLFNVN